MEVASREFRIHRTVPACFGTHEIKRREKDRGRTKALITSYLMRTKHVRRKSQRHEGNVGPETGRARDHFWFSRLRILHACGLWLTSVDRIKWKHVQVIIDHTLEHFPVLTQRSYFSHLTWGLTAFEKPHLVERTWRYLATRSPARPGSIGSAP